jgi:hypothetical protein
LYPRIVPEKAWADAVATTPAREWRARAATGLLIPEHGIAVFAERLADKKPKVIRIGKPRPHDL